MYKEFSHEDSVFESLLYPTGMQVLQAYEIVYINPFNDMIDLFFYGSAIHIVSFAVLHAKFMKNKRRNLK